MKKVLFLCSGNYYRSRFAEHLFNRLAEKQRLCWRAESRGLATGNPVNVGPISPFAQEGLEQRGIHVNGESRFPIQATAADFQQADLIVALKEAEHRAMMTRSFPDWSEQVRYWHIDDLDCALPRDALGRLEQEIEALIARLGRMMP